LASIIGRDHLSYRSAYFPVRNVVDGDLVDRYRLLSDELRVEISRQLQCEPEDIDKKIEEIKNKIL